MYLIASPTTDARSGFIAARKQVYNKSTDVITFIKLLKGLNRIPISADQHVVQQEYRFCLNPNAKLLSKE